MKAHWIYMIGAFHRESIQPHAIKIGIAADVGKRLYDLQTGNHLQLNVMATWRVESFRKARHIENCAHKAFRRHKIRREWFEPRHVEMLHYLNTICAETMPEERREQIRNAVSAQAERVAEIELDMSTLEHLSWLNH